LAYSTITHVERVLAQALTSASPDQPSSGRVDLLQIGNMLDTNNISEDLVNQYIAWADNDINAKLSVL